MYIKNKKQGNQEYLVLTTNEKTDSGKRRVKINLKRIKPIRDIYQMVYGTPQGTIIPIGNSIYIKRNKDKTFIIADYKKYLEREKEFLKSVTDGDTYKVSRIWDFGENDFFSSPGAAICVGDIVKIKVVDGELTCNKGAVTGMKIPYFVLEKIEEKFDFSKIIVDPSKLVKGKRYYVGDVIVELVEHFEEGATSIFDKVKPYWGAVLDSDENNMGIAFAENGNWYSLWYPVEEKYKPYAKPDLAWLGKNVKAKAGGKTTMISKITYSIRGVFVNLSNGIMFELGMMFEHYTWEDGTPFGEVEDERREK
jgi:hypothetical protein